MWLIISSPSIPLPSLLFSQKEVILGFETLHEALVNKKYKDYTPQNRSWTPHTMQLLVGQRGGGYFQIVIGFHQSYAQRLNPIGASFIIKFFYKKGENCRPQMFNIPLVTHVFRSWPILAEFLEFLMGSLFMKTLGFQTGKEIGDLLGVGGDV